MSSVWLAERNDGRFERQVAVKFLNIALMGKGGEERFKREGSILGQLAHPHIADLIDAGVSQAGQPYLVLEYVKGDHIDRYCDEQKLKRRSAHPDFSRGAGGRCAGACQSNCASRP
jgi:serine/threonine protein kinase